MCDGTLIPPLHGLVLVEYIHRLVAFLASVLIPVNAIRMWWVHRGDRLVRRLSILSFFFLATQVVLGALIVVLVLPGAFTTIDVGNSMILLGVLAAMTAVGWREHRQLKTANLEQDLATRANDAKPFRKPVLWATATIFVQALIGGFFRHGGYSEALYGQNAYLLSHHQHVMPNLTVSIFLLILHVGFTALVTGAVAWVVIVSAKQGKYRGLSIALVGLLFYQIVLGIITLQTKLSVISDTLHFAGATALVTVVAYFLALVLLDLASVRVKVREKREKALVAAHS
ncbi:COX15/CtaA family protein [Ferroacidibacillus organovorans]|uniref:Heme A synthase n=1 Tax=Ferroacidibacillus organovorans TaxID=1765683 RepID=A0A162TAA2_9BACL|nr:COX15/CtaA family protein [Ferroacidibacillus organovorans]KYP80609.1 hypothetical protein AYJ22_10850 [Ferroacidibacillus organovorans]OAG92895.1 hypothetical protein AYW79_12860 [Ferroacidibacillus organovorans]OPG15846.1 hypothetical protein B2M26_09565 [Ferroacidibacillus organovorans]